MSATIKQEIGKQLPPKIDRFLERDWLFFRVWVLILGLSVFAYGSWKRIVAETENIRVVEGKVSESLATDIAGLYLVLTHEDPESIKNIECARFNTISGETGSRFFQLSLNYEQQENDGSYQPIQQDLFFDDSGWAQAYGSLN